MNYLIAGAIILLTLLWLQHRQSVNTPMGSPADTSRRQESAEQHPEEAEMEDCDGVPREKNAQALGYLKECREAASEISEFPKRLEYLIAIGLWQARAGDRNAAKSTLEEAIKDTSDISDDSTSTRFVKPADGDSLRVSLACALAEIGEYKASLKACSSGIQTADMLISACTGAAKAAMEVQQMKAVHDFLQLAAEIVKACDRMPSSQQVSGNSREAIVKALAKSGDFDGAMAFLKSSSPSSGRRGIKEILEFQAKDLLRKGDVPRALVMLDKSRQLKEDSADVRFRANSERPTIVPPPSLHDYKAPVSAGKHGDPDTPADLATSLARHDWFLREAAQEIAESGNDASAEKIMSSLSVPPPAYDTATAYDTHNHVISLISHPATEPAVAKASKALRFFEALPESASGLAVLGTALAVAGRTREATERLHQAETRANKISEPQIGVWALAEIARGWAAVGDANRFQGAVAKAESIQCDDASPLGRAAAEGYCTLGRPDDAIQVALKMDDPRLLMDLSLKRIAVGDLAGAATLFAGLETWNGKHNRQLGTAQLSAYAAAYYACLAYASLSDGDAESARKYLSSATDALSVVDSKDLYNSPDPYPALAIIHSSLGNVADAETMAKAAYDPFGQENALLEVCRTRIEIGDCVAAQNLLPNDDKKEGRLILLTAELAYNNAIEHLASFCRAAADPVLRAAAFIGSARGTLGNHPGILDNEIISLFEGRHPKISAVLTVNNKGRN